MTITALRPITCSNCGDQLDEVSDVVRSKVGRCCENLPPIWGRDHETGLFTRPGHLAAEAEVENDEDDQIRCNCGGTRYRCIETGYTRVTRVYVAESAPGLSSVEFCCDYEDEETGDFDSDEAAEVICDDCGRRYRGDWEWV